MFLLPEAPSPQQSPTQNDRQRRLPEIDLARIVVLSVDQQIQALKKMHLGHPPFTYNPFRRRLVDIFNIQADLLTEIEPTEWNHIERMLERNCHTVRELEANMMVAKGMYGFINSHPISGRKQEFSPMRISASESLTYWLPYILSWKGQTLIMFIDPRMSYGLRLNEEGRRFVFSLMHEHIRVLNPDYADVRFSIIQFSKKDVMAGVRYADVHTDEGVTLFSMDEIQHMLSRTYELWREIGNSKDAILQRQQAV